MYIMLYHGNELEFRRPKLDFNQHKPWILLFTNKDGEVEPCSQQLRKMYILTNTIELLNHHGWRNKRGLSVDLPISSSPAHCWANDAFWWFKQRRWGTHYRQYEHIMHTNPDDINGAYPIIVPPADRNGSVTSTSQATELSIDA